MWLNFDSCYNLLSSVLHWRRKLSKILGGQTKILGGRRWKSDKCMGVSQLLGCACPGCPPKVYAYAVHIVFKYLLYLSICIAPLNSHGQTYYRYACYNLRYVRLIIKAKILLLFQSVIAKQIVIFRFFHGICLYPWHVVIG